MPPRSSQGAQGCSGGRRLLRGAGIFALAVFAFLSLAAIFASARYVRDRNFIWQSDSKSFMATARFLAGEPFEEGSTLKRGPVYPLLLLAADAPERRDEFRTVRRVQVGVYAIATVAVLGALCVATRSPWAAAGAALVVLMHRDGLCFVNAVMSESLMVPLLLLFMAFALVACICRRGRYVLSVLAALSLAALGLTRHEYAVAALPVLALTAAWCVSKRTRGAWTRGAVLLVGFCIPWLLWQVFLSARDTGPQRARPKESRAWIMLGKMVAPHFYVGPDNPPDQDAIAMLWNEAYRNGRTGSQGVYNEWLYVRQCYPEYQRGPLKAFDASVWSEMPGPSTYDMDRFSAAIRSLLLRSVIHHPWPIARARLDALASWICGVQFEVPPWRVGCTTLRDFRRDLRSFDYVDLPMDIAILSHHIIPGFYNLPLNLLLYLVLVVCYIVMTPRRAWPFVLTLSVVLWSVLLMVGLFYQGYHPRYKITIHPGFWILNAYLMSEVVCSRLVHFRRAGVRGSATPAGNDT